MGSTTTPEVDPFKADAAVVYRSLRDAGPGSTRDLVARCFPVEGEMPESTRKAIVKRSVRRVQDSIIWMRHQGVTISVVPDADGSVFHLGEISIDMAGRSYTLFTGGKVVQRGSFATASAVAHDESVTPNLSQPLAKPEKREPKPEKDSDAMDVWHGG